MTGLKSIPSTPATLASAHAKLPEGDSMIVVPGPISSRSTARCGIDKAGRALMPRPVQTFEFRKQLDVIVG